MTTPRTPTTLATVRVVARLSRVLERSTQDLSLAHFRVLSAIADGHERATRVASWLALGKPTISAAVDALAKRGLIERHEVAGDQRAAALCLTTEGRELLDRVEREMAARIETLLQATPDPEQTAQSLAWLGQALDDMHAQHIHDKAGGPRA